MADMFSIDGDEIATERRFDRPKPSPRALAAFQAIFKTPAELAPEPHEDDDQVASASEDEQASQASGVGDVEAAGDRASSIATPKNGTPAAKQAEAAASSQRATEVRAAPSETVDRPQSPFHTYDWVLAKLRDKPSTTFLEIRRLADRGRFEVSEGHYKRARQAIAGELPVGGSAKIDAIVEDTIALLRVPIDECRRFRDAAQEIVAICERALRELDRHG